MLNQKHVKNISLQRNFERPPRGNTLKLTRVVWKSTQSSAVVFLNNVFAYSFKKREVLIIRVFVEAEFRGKKRTDLLLAGTICQLSCLLARPCRCVSDFL